MANQFRLATFNLENLDYSAARRAVFERRLGVLKPLLAELAADILCLQEINAQKAADHDGRRFLALDRLLAGGPYEGYHRATSVRPGTSAPADVHNLVIASRWPIVERRQLFHDIVAKWRWTPPAEGRSTQAPVEVAWDRPLLYARVAAPDGAPLHIVNLHLRAPRAVPLQEVGSSQASSRDSSSPRRNARAKRSRRGCSWSACSTRTRRRASSSAAISIRGNMTRPCESARRPRRGYARYNAPHPDSARRTRQ